MIPFDSSWFHCTWIDPLGISFHLQSQFDFFSHPKFPGLISFILFSWKVSRMGWEKNKRNSSWKLGKTKQIDFIFSSSIPSFCLVFIPFFLVTCWGRPHLLIIPFPRSPRRGARLSKAWSGTMAQQGTGSAHLADAGSRRCGNQMETSTGIIYIYICI